MIKIEMQDVCFGYGRKVVLKEMTFQVRPGEMVGLIGPNGCGKSTIIRTLSRIISPHSGKILLDGKNVREIPRQDLARLLGVVPQMPLLPSAFTAFEIVLMGRNPHLSPFQYEGPRELTIAWQAMERTATHSLAERRVSELSGGEIQCLLIARVLAQEPKAILLDEPTANLDIGRQIEILDLIKNLCRENNLTVLAALHDLNLASQYCDRLVLINNGRVHAEGTPKEVITARNIKEVYGAEDCVYLHPVDGLPCVLLNAGNSKSIRTKEEIA
ncbi:ABC transporter ATP-binding protein [candidate division NPL-UPA2 bacterium Unc8]|uniref:ABC transporter ATP-binding protein n=1 Tax=candidate division NPL-UPA2 bacterium Unc8 TaxID=1980939 RepID=A0A399FWJ6_UNCN2|nr:MAG: ABC transporter ATP-binding protein [candidate division NPL-UPA2 bacterium Unc8]